MPSDELDLENLEIAKRWCHARGADWSVRDQAGRGGTAPVFSVSSPDGERALKIYDREFSSGEKGLVEAKRIEQQIALGVHDCPYLIRTYDGGRFEDRFFLLMNRAPGGELEKRLQDVPRAKLRQIAGQVANACMFLRDRGICHRDIKSANVFISDNFEIATLLDVSVTRNIYDPVGIGTDHSGQLPVLATARYSPPEYLFRLLDPGPELWHALDIYQLGALLHDLIMREPLFSKEYTESKENRYRFAWTVATSTPLISASDVEQDLVFTARRALDKDWRRRSHLRLEDFLPGVEVRQARALEALGLSMRPPLPVSTAGAWVRRVSEVTSAVEHSLTEVLRGRGVLARHFNEAGDEDRVKRLRFTWKADRAGGDTVQGEVEFEITIALRDTAGRPTFRCATYLRAVVHGDSRERAAEMPDVPDDSLAVDVLTEQANSSLAQLAAALMKGEG
jgi:hypothetical protein